MAALSLITLPAAQANESPAPRWAADQTLTWTAGDSLAAYTSAPGTALPGEATIVFENSAATGNTSGMAHTLTFTTSDPEYNDDVAVNIMARPNDENGGRHEVTVNLSPGVYHYHCTIPGHGAMEGELVVTGDGGGDDTTPPEASAKLTGEQDGSGAYIGSATVVLQATDDMTGVASVAYALDDGKFTPYESPVIVDGPGDHRVRYRATDAAGNVSEVQETAFTVADGASDDTTPPRSAAAVEGDRDSDGDYLNSATVTLTATDSGSGVARIEYAVNGGEFTEYTEPVLLHSAGDYSFVHRAVDNAGNSSPGREVTFTVTPDPGESAPDPDCPETDDRPMVMVGDEHAHVPNRTDREGCRINERIEDEAAWETADAFRSHVTRVTGALLDEGILDGADRQAVLDAQLINAFDNAPGQLFSPPRGDDPGTDGRQRDAGHIGLQTHSTSDVISFRDIRIKPL